MKRSFFVIGGFLIALVGVGFICPAVAAWRDQGTLPNPGPFLLPLGVLLVLGGLCTLWYELRPLWRH